jgi:hypothetical protein
VPPAAERILNDVAADMSIPPVTELRVALFLITSELTAGVQTPETQGISIPVPGLIAEVLRNALASVAVPQFPFPVPVTVTVAIGMFPLLFGCTPFPSNDGVMT